MRALVTGDQGFIGRHMWKELESRGYDLVGLDPSGSAGFEDVRHIDALVHGHFDLVVHCAYKVGGRAAIDGINTHFAENLALDAHLFRWAVETGQGRVLYFSSSAAYPAYRQTPMWAGYRLRETAFMELDPLGADANYGFAKCVGERLAADARKSGLPVTVVRPFSGYGEDQSLDYPFPSIVRRAMGGDLTVWGPNGQTRDWIHVIDVVKGALAVAESGTEDPVNLCTGLGTEMGELMIKAANMAGVEVTLDQVEYLTDKPTGVFYRVGDPNRMLQHYTPTVTLEEGIRRAIRAQAP